LNNIPEDRMTGCYCCFIGKDDKPCTALAVVQIEDVGTYPREPHTHACADHVTAIAFEHSEFHRFGVPGDSDTVSETPYATA
jgi:hypothetical protein